METTAPLSPIVPLRHALAAATVLAVGMGFGRFSFTGMYPLMVNEGVLSVGSGSLAASANYLGYLLGALGMSGVGPGRSMRLCQIALVGTVLCLAGLGVPLGTGSVVALRFLAGTFSAMAMVMASVWLFQVVGYHGGAPILYGGVGVGILLSAEIIALGSHHAYGSRAIWTFLATVALLLCALAWASLRRPPTARFRDPSDATTSEPDSELTFDPWILTVIYGLAGFGYVVTATYLPLLAQTALGDLDPVQVWAVFGIGASPSCFLWHALHRRLGSRKALLANLLVQTAGVVLPVVSGTAWAFLASAALVGGSFVGTVTIALPAAKRAAAERGFNILATMTAAYGVGQIAGPLVSKALFSRWHSFDPPLLVAGLALLTAGLACLLPSRPPPR